MTSARDPVRRAVATFVVLGVVALAAVGVAGTLVLRRLAPTIGSIRLALGMAVVVVLGGIVWPS